MAEEAVERKKSDVFMENFARVGAKIGNEIHLRSLRDAFSSLTPLYILAGFGTLLSSSVFPYILSGSALEAATGWADLINNGTLNFACVIICGLIGYYLAVNKGFDNPVSCIVVSLSTLIVMMPTTATVSLADGSGDVEASSVLIYNNLGIKGLFAGIIIGLLATELFIRLSRIEKLKINLGEGVPPAVTNAFNALIPMILTVSLWGIVACILQYGFGTNLIDLIKTFVTTPLESLGTSLPAVCLIYTLGNFLFFLGIHQSTINGVLLEPILTTFCTENSEAALAGEAIPHILTMNSLNFFGQLGGTGSTLALIIATYIVGKNKATKTVSATSILPGLFNINEPMIFGYPIVYNLSMLIPFLLCPVLNIVIHYFCMAAGIVSMQTVYVAWNTPIFISGFLGTGGDWRTVVLQAVLLALDTLIYMPFVKISERTAAIQSGDAEAEEA